MKLSRLASLALAALVAAPFSTFAADGVAFALDKNHSNVNFSVRHLGISKVRGSFSDFSALVQADPATGHLTAVEGTVGTASVDTGSDGRDKHLRSDDFFNAETYPNMTLKSKRIKWMGDRFIAHVEMTIRDQTHMVTFNGELLGRQEGKFFGKDQIRVGYSASGKIDRQKFGLKFNKIAEGVSVVGNDVTIELEIQATLAK